jgi:hypothetical protein
MALVSVGFPTAARLVVLIALGAVVYLACLLWRAPEITREIRETVVRRRKPSARIEAAPAQL